MQDNKYDFQANIVLSFIMVGLFILFYFLNDLKEYIKINEIKTNLKDNYSLISTNDDFSKKYITLNGAPNEICSLSIEMEKDKFVDLINTLNHQALIIQYDNKLYIQNNVKDSVNMNTIMNYVNNCINENKYLSNLKLKNKNENLLSWNSFDSNTKN